MNIFVLCTGRCGSTTFWKACTHITNYSTAHESRCNKIGIERLAYPKKHIEIDNRLSWFLGKLDVVYGDQAFYVYLKRDREETARSFTKRFDAPVSIMTAYTKGILMLGDSYKNMDAESLCLDYYDTVNSNIELFLQNKTKKMVFDLSTAKKDYLRFWNEIKAVGQLDKALREWDCLHNAT